MSTADADRLQLGLAAVITPQRAAELLPLGEADALAWLRDQGLVRTMRVGGRSKNVVIWGDVVDALRRGDEPPPKTSRPASGTLPRARLG